MKKASVLPEKKSRERGKYALGNTYARARFRGKTYYEKRCYHCREPFLAVRQDVLSCAQPSCQVAVSRRVGKGQPLRPFPDAPAELGKEIDFVKWGLEAPGQTLDGLRKHQAYIAYAFLKIQAFILDNAPGWVVLTEVLLRETNKSGDYAPDIVVYDERDKPFLAVEVQASPELVAERTGKLSEMKKRYGLKEAYKIYVAGKKPIFYNETGEIMANEKLKGLERDGNGLTLGEITGENVRDVAQQLFPNFNKRLTSLEGEVGELKSEVGGLKSELGELKALIKQVLAKLG